MIVIIPERALRYYRDRRGRSPFLEWLEQLRDQRGRNLIKIHLDRMCLGHWGDWKTVGNSIFEHRLNYGPGYRVYFGRSKKQIILLLGGDKSSQDRNIKKAKEFWRAYESK